jgi:hypothetical protein
MPFFVASTLEKRMRRCGRNSQNLAVFKQQQKNTIETNRKSPNHIKTEFSIDDSDEIILLLN